MSTRNSRKISRETVEVRGNEVQSGRRCFQRGAAEDLSKSKLIKGPDFLWKEDAVWETSVEVTPGSSLSQNDPEVKKGGIFSH